jgi:tRNA 2-thiouridine synthesizing protein E
MDWQRDDGERKALELGIEMTPAHWQVVDFIREYYIENGLPESARLLSDALEEAFREEGGRRYLYTLFPHGPVTQASLIAGLKKPPRFAEDRSFGTAM